MTIGKKIVGGYVLVLALLVLVAAVAFHSLRAIEGAYGGFLELEAQAIIGALELQEDARSQVAEYRGLLLYPDQQARLLSELRESHRQFDARLQELRGSSRSEMGVRLLDLIAGVQRRYKASQERGISLIEEGRQDEAIVQGREAVLISIELRDRFEEFIALQRKQLAEGRSAVRESRDRSFVLLLSIAALSIVVALVLSALLTGGITRQLRGTIAQLSASSTQILATTTQVASGSAETATAVSETTATVEEVKQTAQVASQKAKSVSERAEKASQIAEAGRRSVDETILGMQRIQEQMESIAESIVRLSEQGQTIGSIIATVDGLAEQSNLLAVNAAIEAARAGEQGKGFGVVAQEVKTLAQQSKQATAQVRAILTEIQKATSTAVLATEQGSKAVDAGVEQSTDTGESIRQLAESVTEAAQAAIQIAASSQQQMVGMDQVALAMENIKQASTENLAGTRQAETAAHDLHELGQRLSVMIGGR